MHLSVHFHPRVFILLACIITFVPAKKGVAQHSCDGSDKLTLEVRLSPELENAQVLGLSSLNIDNRGYGTPLISGTMVNNTDELLTNLYFEFSVSAGKFGTLAKVTQQAAYPFTLDPHQMVYVTNNDITNEVLPGVEETMRFDGGITAQGEAFVESLGGSSTLPVDVYTATLTVSQVTNECGKQILATETVVLGGGSSAIADEKSIFLRTPGDVLGTEVFISNQYPQMSWEGDASGAYRVIVVTSDGQDTPESLIQSARSSEPTPTGSLLSFENLDIMVNGNSLQFPSSGAQPLEVGKTYYWQVSTMVATASGSEEITSEIWNFTLTDPSSNAATALQEIDQDTFEALITLIGEEQYNTMVSEGFYFEGVEYNGQVFSGITGAQVIAEIVRKIEEGDIYMGNSN